MNVLFDSEFFDSVMMGSLFLSLITFYKIYEAPAPVIYEGLALIFSVLLTTLTIYNAFNISFNYLIEANVEGIVYSY